MTRLLTHPACLVLLFLMLLPTGAVATEVRGLYEAVVAVSSQAASERTRAVEEGFRQVLVKVSGQRAVLANQVLQSEVARAEALLAAYRYEASPIRHPGQQLDPGTGVLRLRMNFDQQGVMEVMGRAGVPVWVGNRPEVYLWVGRATAGGKHIFGPDSSQGETLIDVAGMRGLPVVLTAAAQPASDGAGAIPPAVTAAAARAGARVILSAATRALAGGWRAAGVLSVDGVAMPLEAVSGDEHAALRELMATAADRLGARYAVVPAGSLRPVSLRVVGVEDLKQYAVLLRWLQKQPLVKGAMVESISTGEVRYVLMVAAETADLVRSLAATGPLGGVELRLGEPGSRPLVEARLLPVLDQ